MGTKISYHEWKLSGGPGNLEWGGDGIQVWLGKVPTLDHEITAHACLLNETEKRRAKRYKVTPPRNEFIFGRGILRQLLAAGLDCSPQEVTLDYEPRGKPRIAGDAYLEDLHFNLAHSHSLVAVALARGRKVGVDIEWMERSLDWLPLAKRVFSRRERDEIHSLPVPAQRLAFFKGWTRKEAFLKATGEGLSDHIQRIEVTMNPDQPAGFLQNHDLHWDPLRWEIQDLLLPPGFAGAIVCERQANVRG
jgi:4'-phosphopantetheinyl transferase